MRERVGRLITVGLVLSWIFAAHVYSQTNEETLSGPDSHEKPLADRGYLFGDWAGLRSDLLERGVSFDLQYVSDSLANVAGERDDRFVAWNRFRGTIDIDFGPLIDAPDWYFHATALWQNGASLGTYLGLLTSPSGMSSEHTFRLDSWWIEKRLFDDRLTIRIGQSAGQDFYGAQHYAASFIFEPMGYALGNLFTDFESFDPPRSAPACSIAVTAELEAAATFANAYRRSSHRPRPSQMGPQGLWRISSDPMVNVLSEIGK
jgi:porin